MSVTVGLYVSLHAKPGKEADVERFLESGQSLVEDEPATTAWFALRLSASEYAIVDVFPNEAGRQAHLSGKVAEALMAKAPELFAEPPQIRQADVLAVKLPGGSTTT
ncbi:MAG: putative quinol monooxygenase [Candidatus Dormibacteria bacterium]